MPGARALAGAAMLVSASSHDEVAPMPHPFGHKRDDMDVHALRSCLEAGDLSFLGDAETVRSIYEMRSGPYDGDLLQTQAVVTVPDTARSAPILEWLPPIDRGTGVPNHAAGLTFGPEPVQDGTFIAEIWVPSNITEPLPVRARVPLSRSLSLAYRPRGPRWRTDAPRVDPHARTRPIS